MTPVLYRPPTMRTFVTAAAAAVPAAVLLPFASAQEPAFRPARLFGDHMVLPASCRAPVHGWGPAGAAVEVRASWGSVATATVGADGRWRCALETPARGTAGELTFASGGVELRARDVLVGDVWLASGQSNMEMPVGRQGSWSGVRDWQQEVLAADWQELRVFTVGRRASDAAVDDVDGAWRVCSPATAADFSATAYFFAKELLQRGVAPIGLVVSSWGGTVIEAWMAESAFPAGEGGDAALAPQRQAAGDAAKRDAFWRAVERVAPTAAPVAVELPERWSQGELADFDGVVDYRRSLRLPDGLVGEQLVLELGAIDDMDTVLWNGERVAGTEHDGAWATPRRYVVPAERTQRTDVELVVRVVDTGGEGGFSGSPGELKLALANDAAEAVPLAGTWQRTVRAAMAALPEWPRPPRAPQNRPTWLWNGMIAPLLPFPFTGVVWYQGESNRGAPEVYAERFPAMIRDWRRRIGKELPFYFVQIAPYGYRPDDDERTARLRRAQAAALALPATGMVVTLDCGDAKDIHPAAKQPVGQRLALLALAGHYGVDVVAEGPRLTAAVRAGGAVRLRFAAAAGRLELRNGGAGFELAAADGRFVPATARLDDDGVVLEAAGVGTPTRVRYAWHAVPAWSLCGGTGLPAAPFEAAID